MINNSNLIEFRNIINLLVEDMDYDTWITVAEPFNDAIDIIGNIKPNIFNVNDNL